MQPPPPAQIIIAVIGALGCGKSTVIRKGLKAYGLSEPTVATISASPAESREDALTCEHFFHISRYYCVWSLIMVRCKIPTGLADYAFLAGQIVYCVY